MPHNHQKTVCVLGSGHLALHAKERLTASGYRVITVTSADFEEIVWTDVQESSFDYARTVLRGKGIEQADAICVLDKEDRRNIHLLLAALTLNHTAPTIVALTNEDLGRCFELNHRNVRICNPAAIATPLFVEAIDGPASHAKSRDVITATRETIVAWHHDYLVRWLVGCFFLIVAGGTSFFCATEHVNIPDGLYLTLSMFTSVNFNDVTLHDYEPTIKLTRTIMMFVIWIFSVLATAFIISWLMKRRDEIRVLGRKKYHFKNHIIVCGLGRVGYRVVQALLRCGEKVIVIEDNEENRFLEIVRSLGARVFVGDASISKNLVDVGIHKAKALMLLVSNDLLNLEVGLNARALQPKLRLILRIFDKGVADEMKGRLDIQHAISTSAIATDLILDTLREAFEGIPKTFEAHHVRNLRKDGI